MTQAEAVTVVITGIVVGIALVCSFIGKKKMIHSTQTRLNDIILLFFYSC